MAHQGREESTRLFLEIKNGRMEAIRAIISKEPELVNTCDDKGLSPVTVALYYGRRLIADFLIANGARLDVFEASAAGRTDRIKELLKQNRGLINGFSVDGFTPLHLAAFFGNLESAKVLLESGAEVNIAARNPMKVMPLHSAAAGNHTEIARILVEKGAEVNATQEGGFTPLHSAAMNGNSELAKFLLSHGASVNAKTAEGQSPLALTREEGPEAGPKQARSEVAELLIGAGAVE